MFASVFIAGEFRRSGGEFLFGRPKRNQKAARGPFRWALRAHIHGPLDPVLRGAQLGSLGSQRKGAGGRRLASGLSPLPLRVRQPLGISPPGGERAFGVGGAQVRLSEATHPETFRDFRRRVTLGRPRFLGFSHVVCPFGTFPPDSGNRPSPLEGEGLAGGHPGPPLQEVRNPPPHPPPSGAPPPKGKVSRSSMFHTGRVGSAT